MKCSKCNGDLRVKDTRNLKERIYRRKECKSCGYRVTTCEVTSAEYPSKNLQYSNAELTIWFKSQLICTKRLSRKEMKKITKIGKEVSRVLSGTGN